MTDPLWKFRILLEQGTEPHCPVRVSVTTEARAGDVAEALDEMFTAEPDLDRVTLVVDGQVLGVSSRSVLATLRMSTERLRAPMGDDAGVGDGATLPGHSTGYVVLRFRCATCDTENRLLFVDGGAPDCPEGHGVMERVA